MPQTGYHAPDEMNLKQTTSWRSRIGKTGTLLCVLLFLAVSDGLISRFREPLNHFSCLPGNRIAISGPLKEKIANPGELTSLCDVPEIRIVFETVQTGFWLGGYLWSGTLEVGPRIQPGEYTLMVQTGKKPEIKTGTLFRIEVHKDLGQLKQRSKSFFMRTLGVSPWRAAFLIIPLILMIFGTVFFLSRKIETLLADLGEAEVYRIRKGIGGSEIFFGLGSRHKIKPGTCLTILNKQGGVVGSVTPQEIFEDHSIARVNPESVVQPGFMIRIKSS
jgi:hypothetical protein